MIYSLYRTKMLVSGITRRCRRQQRMLLSDAFSNDQLSVYQLSLYITLTLYFLHTTAVLCTVSGLECYACDNQDGNQDKCIKTTKQCEQEQDICQSTISWGLPRYWTPYGDRVHYVSKDCSTWEACKAEKAAILNQCRRDWFDDWMCIECCSGDLCNYYVTLTAPRIGGRGNVTTMVNGLIILQLLYYLGLQRQYF